MTRVALVSGFVLAITFASAGADDKPLPAGSGRVAAKEYVEVDEKGVANARFRLRVREATPNILEIRGINGWVAFTSYDEGQKEYRGFFEWQQMGALGNPGGKWADLYQVRLVRQANGELLMTGKSKNNDFVIRAKEYGPTP
ncbi:hypothetical protein R5W23_001724 [Gemmata sp. JC673]|uniref:Uncharacterized protein n=1 Tax=Gemmata algarum TaxID=2975278 RepID=A0ABU5F3P6_9BACT|nr:hypothetical protein [Gemmata algarum]MDY3560489.1 hypothetical protein [Gemmata algarum]